MPKPPTLHRNSNALLRKVLEEPGLDRWVRELRGPDWKALVRQIGLEDSSELLALSTPDQLVELIDETLWVEGDAEGFDMERFATLLEVLHESGTQDLADRIARLPEEFLILAMSRLISVWPSDFLRQLAETDETGVLDKRLDNQMFEEFDEYTVLSASGLAWDPMVALLLTWMDSEPELFSRILGRLSAASIGGIGEPDELLNVLDEMAEFEEEAQGEREGRRARSGYVSGSDARAFLRLPPTTARCESDAISTAYFRRLAPEPLRPGQSRDNRILEILRSHSPRGTGRERRLNDGSGLLKEALDQLALNSPERHARAIEELAFLTNVLVAAQPDIRERDKGPNAADAIRSVVAAVEASGVGRGELDATAAKKKLVAALELSGPIALFRNRPR